MRVVETIVTPSDVAGRRGSPFLIRFFNGLIRPKGTSGTDFAGEVEAAGQSGVAKVLDSLRFEVDLAMGLLWVCRWVSLLACQSACRWVLLSVWWSAWPLA